MPGPAVAAIGAVGSIAGGVISGSATRSAGREAAQATSDATALSVAEQSRQFERATEILSDYVKIGTGEEGGAQGSIQAQQALLGLLGDEEQQNAITSIEEGAEYQALARQGEEAILQNASATGGLRGGNTQGALAQFRPQLLNQLIQQRYGNLAGLTQLGQASAAGTASIGQATGANIGATYQQGGINRANILANTSGAIGQNIGQSIGDLTGLYVGSKF